jgi:flagellar hook-associated protein 3 FlgL
MRITDSATLFANWQNLQTQRQDQDRLQQQLSSGKRINLDSDDPTAAAEIQGLRRKMAYLEQYGKNASYCDGLLKYTDSTLQGVSDALLRVIETGVQGTSSVVNADERKTLASQIRSIKDELVSLANSKYQDEYLFGGVQSQGAPFSVDSGTGKVSFVGSDTVLTVPVAEGMEVQPGLSGATLFMDKTDLFTAMDDLASAIEAGNGGAVMTQVSEIEKARLAVSEARGALGHQMQIIERVQQQMDQDHVNLLARLSKLEDADVGEIVSRLSLNQTAITATLYAQAQIGQKTLFDFIG